MADLTLSNIVKNYGPVEVLKNIDLHVPDGEFVVFVGPSGCGKSTLLRAIAGLEDLSGGSIKIGGEDVADRAPAQRGIAMVFQTYALYPHKSVFDNMAYGLKLARRPRDQIRAEVMKVAKILELEALLDRKPAQLSGGQRQRVAIGRAIVRDPKVFLFDEPLSNLDAALRGQMRIEIADLHARLKATMVYVTHDQIEAMTMADRIVVLNAGRIEQQGAPLELYHHPANLFVAGFLGAPSMNFVPARAIGASAAGAEIEVEGIGRLTVPVDGAPAAGTALTLGLRPHDFSLERGGMDCEIDTVLVEPLGHETIVYGALRDGGPRMTIALEGGPLLRTGVKTRFRFDPADCHLFGPDGIAYRRRKQHFTPLASGASEQGANP
ncbi:MAG: sn-glycerol-3-phosphate ABC transporter ATP-binding protein UgpC [Devosia nanyangense]|uniref:Sn-glycerol-3-phosphate ABC transporter ATP-binding protein UgpC n=1 Tax=Devosia nanyangense TaxID=1228055 RepID=A0A933NYH9_9HYPH|nr:sn-glycerol-3-phosphate ABC transporter ATP-binding protein UgpC [Devosia nanyangense]